MCQTRSRRTRRDRRLSGRSPAWCCHRSGERHHTGVLGSAIGLPATRSSGCCSVMVASNSRGAPGPFSLAPSSETSVNLHLPQRVSGGTLDHHNILHAAQLGRPKGGFSSLIRRVCRYVQVGRDGVPDQYHRAQHCAERGDRRTVISVFGHALVVFARSAWRFRFSTSANCSTRSACARLSAASPSFA